MEDKKKTLSCDEVLALTSTVNVVFVMFAAVNTLSVLMLINI